MQIWSQKKNRFFISYLLTYSAIYLTLRVFNYWPLQATNRWSWDSSIGDLGTILRLMDCSQQHGTEIYNISSPNRCGGYTYGYFFARIMGWLGLHEGFASHTRIVLVVLYVLSSSALSTYLQLEMRLSRLIILLVFASPPTWLAIVHGSLDLLIFSILTLSCFLFTRLPLLSFLLIAIATFIKMFTLPLLVLAGIKLLKESPTITRSILLFVVLLSTMINTGVDYFRVDWNDPAFRIASGLFFVFGITSMTNWLKLFYFKLFDTQLIISDFESQITSLFIFLLALFAISLFAFGKPKSMKSSTLEPIYNVKNINFDSNIFFSFSFASLALFLQGQNWDNKLIFFAIPCLLLSKRFESVSFKFLVLCNFYLTCLYPFDRDATLFSVFQFLGDFSNYWICCLIVFFALINSITRPYFLHRKHQS
jgi:hypothetical protein